MIVHFVGAGPGDPELLTQRAARLLRTCRICIYAGSLVSPDVLALLPEQTERHDSAGMSLDQAIDVCRSARDRGLDVVRLHSGDPSIYGAIREQMDALDACGIPYDVCPGVSSFQAAAAALCTELTAPEISQTIVLTRTAGRTPIPAEQELDQLARTHSTLCVFLSVERIAAVAVTLAAHYGPACPAAVVYRASWPEERIVRGTLADIADKTAAAGIRATAMIIVGLALARNLPASKLYDAAFSHGFRNGAGPGTGALR
jgi:precorrin-4/cobalt-precorrin-4 C11-methyltransferase